MLDEKPDQPQPESVTHAAVWERQGDCFSVMTVCGTESAPLVTGYWHDADGPDPDRHDSIPFQEFLADFEFVRLGEPRQSVADGGKDQWWELCHDEAADPRPVTVYGPEIPQGGSVEVVPASSLQASNQALAQAVEALDMLTEVLERVDIEGEAGHMADFEEAFSDAVSALTQLQPESG